MIVVEPIDPALFEREDLRAALAGHDIGAVYRALKDVGVSQRRIAALTGQSQSEVSEIVHGRAVHDYRVLVRIAEGLGVPREWMWLSCGAYPGGVMAGDLPKGVDEQMYRRVLLAAAGMVVMGRPLRGIWELAGPSPVPLPSRVLGLHVVQVRDLTQRLGEVARAYGADPQVSSAAAGWASGLLDVSGDEPVKRALLTAVAELHLQAGFEAYHAGLYDRAMYHYNQGLRLAAKSGDPYCQTLALNMAGSATVEHGHPNDGLKMLQFAQVKALDITPDSERAVVGPGSRAALEACTLADSAIPLARLGHFDAAYAALAQGRERWQPTPTVPVGDLGPVSAQLELERGRLDAAEDFAAGSVRLWEGRSGRRGRTLAGILLATIHVRAGESEGVRLAHEAITGTMKLSSVLVRRRLEPLAVALEARPGNDYRELARTARQVATTRV